jgi:hypothetical protein
MADDRTNRNVSSRPAGILPDRAQPHNLKVEQAVLAAMLRDPKGCIDTVVGIIGAAGDAFYSAANRSIFLAALELHRNDATPDLLTVAQQLQAAGKLEAAGGGDTTEAPAEAPETDSETDTGGDDFDLQPVGVEVEEKFETDENGKIILTEDQEILDQSDFLTETDHLPTPEELNEKIDFSENN